MARKCRPRCTLFRRGKKPTKLRTDKGVEFRNRDVQHLLKVERMDHLYTQNEQKSSYAERCIRTLKAKLFRYLSRHQTHYWIDVLQRKLSSFHQDGSPSGDQERRSPFVETPVHHQTVRQDTDTTLRVPERRHRLYLARETTVRSGIRRTMDDGIYFVVDDRGMKEGIPYYTLKDTIGDAVQGTFYQPELNRVKVTEETVYRIEKVILRRRNDALVKWMGWPSKFNSWIPTASLKDFQRSEG